MRAESAGLIMTSQSPKSEKPGKGHKRIGPKGPEASWCEKDQRYYMKGERNRIKRERSNAWIPEPWE